MTSSPAAQSLTERGAESSPSPPALDGIHETSLYVEDLAIAEDFYGRVLGLSKVSSVPGRLVAFKTHESILLLFDPSATRKDKVEVNGSPIPVHGTSGAGHTAFRVTARELEAWRRYLPLAGVRVESEVLWPNDARSIYFRDPAGNSIELVTPTIWDPLPQGG
jgi:catechol 2,3-dioxygenase-like lactoylglutathione lyase family enzyme